MDDDTRTTENASASTPTTRDELDAATLSRRDSLRLGCGIAASAVTVGGLGGTVAAADNPIEIGFEDADSPGDVYRVFGDSAANATITSDVAAAGSHSLRITAEENGSWGTNASYRFPDNGHGQPDAIYQRIRIRLGEDFALGEDGNTCRLLNAGLNTEAGPNGAGGGRPSGADGWSVRYYVTRRGSSQSGPFNLLAYTYHINQDDNYGDEEVIDVSIQRGEWFTLETYVELNTVSNGEENTDGISRCWLDGDLVYERENFAWRDTTSMGHEYVGPVVHVGGRETAPNRMHTYYDNHQIWVDEMPDRSSVGWGGSGSDDSGSGAPTDGSRLQLIPTGGEAVEYEIVVDGDVSVVESGPHDAGDADTLSTNDDGTTTIDGTTGNTTSAGGDTYDLGGEVLSFTANGPLSVTLDGESTSVSELDSGRDKFTIVPTGTSVEYTLDVDGSVSFVTEGSHNAGDSDSITENGDGTVTVEGLTGSSSSSGGDTMLVDGEITGLSTDDDSPDVYVNGSATSADELGDTGPQGRLLEISRAPGSSGTVKYIVETDGSVKPGSHRNDDHYVGGVDAIHGSNASGEVSDDVDPYVLEGVSRIEVTSAGGNLTTTVDGQELDLSEPTSI